MFICMAGIPGSGKSTKAYEIAEKYKGIVISTDEIREEINGDAADQSNGWEVFEIAYNRITMHLMAGDVVVFDATNLSRKARKRLLRKIHWFLGKKVIYYLDCPLEIALKRNSGRDRVVSEEYIEKAFTKFIIPQLDEGWNEIYRIEIN